MNMVQGRILNAHEGEKALERLEGQIIKTLEKPRLDPTLVIDACDAMAASMNGHQTTALMAELGVSAATAQQYLSKMKLFFSKEYLQARLKREFDGFADGPEEYVPPFFGTAVREEVYPLGVLLHIAAGNIDGLPIYSVLEGLITGNINILKLPQTGGGLTVQLLMQLFTIQPALAEYVYVFDYTSRDTEAIKALANLADAIVVWGGDRAVSAMRRIANPNTKIIEWGHKISFAYITQKGINDAALEKLAHNICETNQLTCSSCQGVFMDTQNMEEVKAFCKRFLPVLQRVSAKFPNPHMQAQSKLAKHVYRRQLEVMYDDAIVYEQNNCSLVAQEDAKLETSLLYHSAWVKRLPRAKITRKLRPYKNYLQAVALLCAEEEKPALSEAFFRAGLVRVVKNADVSAHFCGAPHDGSYPLHFYTKVTCIE